MWLVVGLGNPGAKYEETRHNAGFLVVDEVARRWGMGSGRSHLGASTIRGTVARSAVLLAKPQTYMNRSGEPAGALQRFHDVPLERVVVVHDDLDLPFGSLRIKRGGGHGGHNGLRDLHGHIGAEFLRVRFGISRPPADLDAADYVLGRWDDGERQALPLVVDRGADAVEAIITDGPTVAMNAFNVRPRRSKASGEESAPSDDSDASATAEPAAVVQDGASNPTAPEGARS